MRVLRKAELLGERSGREFDLWLIALRAGPATPAVAAERLGVTPARLRPQISRALRVPERARHFRRGDDGIYHLTAAGARRADAVITALRRVFRGLHTLSAAQAEGQTTGERAVDETLGGR